MTANVSGRAVSFALVLVIVSTLAIATGSGVVAAQTCEPANGTVSGCDGDLGTVRSIGGNVYSVFDTGLIFAGLSFVAAGLIFWGSGGFSATLRSRGGFLVGGGIIILIAAFALEPLLGLLEWIATNGV